MFKKVFTITAIAASTASSALAATDGSLGSTSTGDFDITITINELVRISGLSDVAFGTYGGTGILQDNQNICVYTNDAAADYKITLDNPNNSGTFELADGTNKIAYSVLFNDAAGTTGQTAVTAGSALTAQSGANTSSIDCSVGGDSANVEVSIAEGDLQAAPIGSYTGTLQLVLEPS